MKYRWYTPCSLRINWCFYDTDLCELTIQFRDKKRRTYKYIRVPHNIASELYNAESPGKFFEANIKGKFTYSEITSLINPPI